MNTYLKRPIKKPFVSNSKKIVIPINRNEDAHLDMAYPARSDQQWREDTAIVLDTEAHNLWYKTNEPYVKGDRKKTGVLKANRTETTKWSMLPFYRTRDFRKKIAFLYYPVLT
jgi:hypothetical protein